MTEIPCKGIILLHELENNNTKSWFSVHKAEIDQYVTDPSREAGEELRELVESLSGTPMTVKFFRMHRDIRFSADKSPYNPHVRFSIWPASQTMCESVCFHFSIETLKLALGVGVWEFKDRLTQFRSKCSEIEPLLLSGMRVSEPELKKVPKGFEPTQPWSDHYRRKGLTVWFDNEHTENQASSFNPDQVKLLLPVYKWLSELA